ncbi:hypothetical protein A3E46_02570 [Candidatus Woesebacteria bacterium RIFCSPHIGHO2_12_FULL_46_16]|uniref:Uncharacterized protein n=1 Tax=Candidatus Woesebacteria bacterium RIFCSPHIGHO2_12_FULL_46_16 TaxID=1802513 RepID=A0A1F8B2H9_9BACT|nr:MAG: hypothetical protein A3E46_02570 [Candidatus Woesebacteria bacterium RIFCSPHIGHO2_12_FULL_46_16]
MKELLTFILKGITGKEIPVEESSEGERINFVITPPEDLIGIVIGKGGKTIKAIRNILKVRATLEKKIFFLSVEPQK